MSNLVGHCHLYNSIVQYNDEDYISLTDMARSQMQEHIIFRWLSLKSTIEYIGEWETLYNPHFNCTEFGAIRYATYVSWLFTRPKRRNARVDVKDWVKLETPAKYGLVKYAYRGHCKTRAEFFKHCENNPVIFS